jgi:hypothetical protein
MNSSPKKSATKAAHERGEPLREALLYAVGRKSNADLLNLEAAGVLIDKRAGSASTSVFKPQSHTSMPQGMSSTFRRWRRPRSPPI